MKAKNVASSKLAVGKARIQDMAAEIILAEQRLRDLKEKKGILDTTIGKLQLDIIKVESKLSKKQAHHREKLAVVEGARKALEESPIGQRRGSSTVRGAKIGR